MRTFEHDPLQAGRMIAQPATSAADPSPRSMKPHMLEQDVYRDASTPLFIEDRKGDRQNLAYGASDRYAVPRYRASGRGGVLGLGPRYRITSRTESRCEVENVQLDSTRKTRKQSLLSNVVSEAPVPLKPVPEAGNNIDLQKNFLEFEHSYSRKRRRIGMQLDTRTSDADGHTSTGSDSETDNETDNPFEAFKRDPVHQRHVELSKATVENPQDPKVWLAFIDYQETSFSREHGHRALGVSSGRSLIDLKLSLYEQALSHVKDPEGRQSLILGMMQEGGKIWDAEKQSLKWRDVLNKDSSFDLWILYLNFVQSNQVRFTFENCLEIYKACLQNFRAAEAGRKRDSYCIYLLLRCTLFLWQAGFTERGLGVWQALFEYNFFRPQHSSQEELLESFHQFWASEVARIGEEGAKGWGSMTSAELEAKTDEQHSLISGGDFAAWAAAENELDRCATMPARALDEVSEDDPYRVLLFSDIKDFLFTAGTTEGLAMLQDAFLLFAGLPVMSSHAEPRDWKGDPFIFTNSDSAARLTLSLEPREDDLNHYTLASDEQTSLHPNVLSSSRTVAELHFSFVRRFLLQLATASSCAGTDESLSEYVIALEARVDLKSARKQAKTFLKQRPDSLFLYNAYAVIECQLENLAAAERVWSTAISMRDSLGAEAERATFPLWRAWAYSYMARRRFRDAEVLLGMLTDNQIDMAKLRNPHSGDSTQSIATRTKTQRYIQHQFETSLSKSDTRMLPALIDVMAIHQYLTQELSPDAVLEVYDSSLKALSERWTSDHPVMEFVHECRAHLLHSHATTFGRPYKPKEYCLILTESVRIFPDNLRLLILQNHYVQKSGLVDRLRQLDAHAHGQERRDRASASVIPCIFDILTELNRPDYAGSTDHSIHSAFRRATGQEGSGYHCMIVWKAFLLWEISVGSREHHESRERRQTPEVQRRQKLQLAAEVFYASLRACPWAKELYMLAFGEHILSHSLGPEGLERVYGSMQDRGLRLHIDLSESVL